MKTVILSKIETRKGQYRILFLCDNCGEKHTDKESHFNRKKRHYCSMKCYAENRSKWDKSDQNRYGTGMPEDERNKRIKCRSKTNKAIISGKLKRMPCQDCGDEVSEAHHDDYNEPLSVRWLCFAHHRAWHKRNPELLEK